MIRDGCLGDNISAVNRQAATFSSNLHRVESGARLKATLLEWRTRRCAAVRFTRVLASLYIKERDETFSCLLLFFWKGSCMPHINVRIRGPYTESNRTEVKECLVDATHRTEKEEEN